MNSLGDDLEWSLGRPARDASVRYNAIGSAGGAFLYSTRNSSRKSSVCKGFEACSARDTFEWPTGILDLVYLDFQSCLKVVLDES